MRKGTVIAWTSVVGTALMIPLNLWGQQPQGPQLTIKDPYEVGRTLPPLDSGQTLVSMTLEEATARALERNLDIQSVRLSPLIQRYALEVARAVFTPTLRATYGYDNSSRASTSQLDGGSRIASVRQTFNTSLSQTVPWYGGELSANFNNGRTVTDNSFTTLNPSYSSSVSLSYTQPLLAGFSTDNERTAVRTQEIQSQITDIQVLTRIANITNQVRVAYWGLRATIEQIEIQRRNLAQAEQLLADNRVRVQLGRMADIQIFQAEAQVASSEQSLLNAEIQWQNQELALKRLLVNGATDPLLGETLNPTDLPTLVEQVPDIDAAIEIALRERTDIRQQREEQRVADLNLDVTKQESRPDLALTASYALQGVGGDLFERGELGGDPVLVQEGGYFDGLSSIADFETPTWSVTLSASYPVGMRAGRASFERAELQLRQAELALRGQELAIVTEVTNAGLTVNNTYLQVEAATRSRLAAERSLEAEVARFGVGVATNFEVVAAQDALTSARLSELRAIIDHVNALAEFERVQRVGG